jgi:hypothetical protein
MIHMMIFGKKRDSLRIKRIRASRAVFVNQDIQEVHIEFITEDGERLTLQLASRMVPGLIGDLTDSYEAINPPLSRRSNGAAGWEGSGL